jgi:hypothetical protein
VIHPLALGLLLLLLPLLALVLLLQETELRKHQSKNGSVDSPSLQACHLGITTQWWGVSSSCTLACAVLRRY